MSSWIRLICIGLVLSLWVVSLLACESLEEICPPFSTQGDVLANEIDTSHCCEALSICCKGVSAGEDKTKCEEDLLQGGDVSCQARYYSLVSFELCEPVYVRDYPKLKPKPVKR